MSTQLVASGIRLALGRHEHLPTILRGWRLPLALAMVPVAVGLAWQWSWLTAIGVVPVVLSVAPCAAMCGLGLCGSKLLGGSCKSSSTVGNSPPTVPRLASQTDTPETTIRN